MGISIRRISGLLFARCRPRLKDGTLQVGPPELIFDEDFQGQADADKKFQELVKQAEREGFRVPSSMDILEFQAKAQEQRTAKS
jgi:hypothetical protein